MRMAMMAGLMLAACAPTTAQAPADGPGAPLMGSCDASKVQDLVGKPAASVADDAKARSGAKVVRKYVTGSALTMDYSLDRLNIETDANGMIVKLSCG